ncbi:hypothetical protein BKA62DRAFT_32791 [Auriculariales sp. MPI-PUGE-AT-0066]|nr:hypothetical protein BKA62DRAFT_32791 [Auriculariales sp. MPI-PUGE-AT-0066]
MASTAASTARRAGPSSSPLSSREEAGPLPHKVGELGYPSSAPSSPVPEPTQEADVTDIDIDGRHPAERERDGTRPSVSRIPTSASAAPSSTVQSASQSTTSLPAKQHSWYKRIFSIKAGPLVAGFRGPTLLKLLLLMLIVAGLAAGWAISSIRVTAAAKAADEKSDKNTFDNMTAYMGVFLHVAFAVVILVLLVFMERTIFVLRAERWIHTHPGETLPLHRGGDRVGRSLDGLSAAPWNRPPLPTYAAALGFRGTGDVEDDVIAAPPPPAYGNTRGSVLLLASAALRRLSGGSSGNRLSQLRSPHTPRTPREFQQIPESRPISYISTEGLQDIERAHQLEMSLARLEGPTASSSSSGTPVASRQ